MIKAPYNFVPLAQKVVFPEWADQISIDQPFEDGISGTINVKYTAQTPVFVGNGKGDNNSPIPNYRAANGKYAIPGSSLRGMLRNVIEIASFGKFNRVSDAALSVRDLQNRELYTNYFTKKEKVIYEAISKKEKVIYEALSKAGWLVQDNESKEWILYPVEYYRVEDKKLEACYQKDLKNKDSKKRISRISNKVKVYFIPTSTQIHKHHYIEKIHDIMRLKYAKVEKIELNPFPNSKCGFSVLTGSCGRKHMDFIFEDKNCKVIKIPNKIIKKFDDINVPNSANQKSGIALRRELEDYKKFGYPGLPVFYLTDQNNELFAMGLAQMFKLPYKYNLHEAINNSSSDNFSDKLDFAECIFGKVKDTTKNDSENNISLRGRVQVEDAVSNNASLTEEEVRIVLNNPKPTYYPNYIEQDKNKGDYKTLMDDNVKLRGWKRYPVKDVIPGYGQDKLESRFTPLKSNTIFEGKIHFHNLKQEELGSLLWAITWGENKELSHSVGMGKPYGYGQIKAEITSVIYLKNNAVDAGGEICNDYRESSESEMNDWMNSFESYMDKKENIPNWKNSTQLKELFAMANPKNADRPGWKLDYMNLGNKEFVTAKKKEYKEFLAPYSSEKQEMHLSDIEGNNSNR